MISDNIPEVQQSEMGDFIGKVVLITGAGAGIGRALSEAFAAQGAIVAANDLTPINLDQTIARIQSAGGQAQAYVADIASKLALQTMLNEITDQHDRIDILLQTAIVDPPDPILEMDEWDWRRTLDINLTGPFLLMQSVGRIMREQGGGVIVNMISVDGKSSAAFAGKSGLIGLTRAAATEFAAFNIRINAVCSGVPEAEQIIGVPENPVELVVFLCSSEATEFYGQVLEARIE